MVTVGCYSGFWGDSPLAPAQQLVDARVEYLVGDYLAEVTMGILAALKMRSAPGYIPDFVKLWRKLGTEITRNNTVVLTNAGGLDPVACKLKIEEINRELGISTVVAAVTGDNILHLDNLVLEQFSYEHTAADKLPETSPIALNAYLGAQPLVYALSKGAKVVITGRVVDSALVLAPIVYSFNYKWTDYDLLAAASVAGHVIECGCQATGGNFTDWRKVVTSHNGGWANMGYPIIEFHANGEFVVTKPLGTGGLVSTATVSEQLVYEIMDPANYMLPDVIADMQNVWVRQIDTDRVLVGGVRGKAPSNKYKVSGIYIDGFKSSAELIIAGSDAYEKVLFSANYRQNV